MAFAAAGSAPGISSIAAVGTALGSAQNAQRQAVLVKVSAVFLQIQVDLQSRMTYTYSDWSPAQARTPSFGRGEIIIYKPFVTFNINPSLKAYALIHEHAHYARGSWRSITDVGSTWFTTGAYAELDFKKYENLSTEDALRNADCYAWFARELTDTGFYWPP